MSNSLRKKFSMGLATAVLTLSLGAGAVSAESGLNGIGTSDTEQVQQGQTSTNTQSNTQSNTQQNTGSNADAVGEMFGNVGVDEKSAKEANQYMSPLADTANFVFSLILTFAFIAMFIITALDLLYIGVPPLRSLLYSGGSSSGGGGGFGGGGFGGGGFGGGGGGQSSGSKKQYISDEAVAALGSSSGSSGGGGFGGGGFGGGGFGGGGGGSQESSKKSVIISYFKKRVVFLVAFGIVAVLLSSTLFTDIGVSIANWVFNRLTGINSSIPD